MNTDTIMMKRCPSHEDNYELKPRPLFLQIKEDKQDEKDEKDYEDDGRFTCKHGVDMSRRDPTVCDECYWNSRPTDEANNYNDSLLQLKEQEQELEEQVKDQEGEEDEEGKQEKEEDEEYYDDYDEIQSLEEECYNFDLYDREITYYNGRFLLGRDECEEYERICKRIAAYEEKYYTK